MRKLNNFYVVRGACGEVLPEGRHCRLPESLCIDQEVPVRDYICKNSEWLWADEPEFCAGFEPCQWRDYTNLTCVNGTSRPAEYRVDLTTLPSNMDPRIEHLVIRNFPGIYHFGGGFARSLTRLRSIVINHTRLYHLDRTGVASLTLLAYADFRHNKLEHLSSESLPPFRQLKYLDLRDNPFVTPFFDGFTLHASFPFICGLTVPQSQLLMDNNECRLVLDDQGCQRVQCDTVAQQVIESTCVDNSKSFHAIRKCDGIADCSDGSDEDLCNGTLTLDNPTGVCQMVHDAIDTFQITSGLLVLRIVTYTDLSIPLQDVPVVVVRLGNDTINFVETDNDTSYEIYGQLMGRELELQILSRAAGDASHVDTCTGRLLATMTASTPSPAGRSNEAISASVAVPIVAVLSCLVLIVATVGYLRGWHRRLSHQRKAVIGSLVSHSIAEVRKREERKDVEYQIPFFN